MSHYSDVIMSPTASRITGVTVVHSTVCSGVDQRKHQSSASLTFVRGIHRSRVHSPHKRPVTRKMFPFHDVSMQKWDHIYDHIYICIYILDSNLVITYPADVQALLGARLSAGSLLKFEYVSLQVSEAVDDSVTDLRTSDIQNGRQNPQKYRGASRFINICNKQVIRVNELKRLDRRWVCIKIVAPSMATSRRALFLVYLQISMLQKETPIFKNSPIRLLVTSMHKLPAKHT